MNLTTVKSKLPYEFEVIVEAVKIKNTSGQVLIVTRDQITRQLLREDLDPHRRRMYEEAQRRLREAGRK